MRLAVQGSASQSTGAAPGPEWLPLVEARSTAALGCPPTSWGALEVARSPPLKATGRHLP